MIRISIRRPVAVAMAYLALTLLGFAAWQRIPIELLPSTELPRLTMRAQWPARALAGGDGSISHRAAVSGHPAGAGDRAGELGVEPGVRRRGPENDRERVRVWRRAPAEAEAEPEGVIGAVPGD